MQREPRLDAGSEEGIRKDCDAPLPGGNPPIPSTNWLVRYFQSSHPPKGSENFLIYEERKFTRVSLKEYGNLV